VATFDPQPRAPLPRCFVYCLETTWSCTHLRYRGLFCSFAFYRHDSPLNWNIVVTSTVERNTYLSKVDGKVLLKLDLRRDIIGRGDIIMETVETLSRLQPVDIMNSKLDDRKPHKHQDAAINALDCYFNISGREPAPKSGMLVMPTGSGKTYTAVYWLLKEASKHGYQVIWLAHRQELIDQADWTFRERSAMLKAHGFKQFKIIPISGEHALMSMASGYDVNVCSIQSVASKFGSRYIERMLGDKGKNKVIIIIDEAHHAVSASYKEVIKRITELNPDRLLLGLTATPTRMQDTEKVQLNKIFNVYENIKDGRGSAQGFIYEVTLKELLINGFLAHPIYKRVEIEIDADIKFNISQEDEKHFSKFGDLSDKIKDQIAKSSSRNKLIVDEYMKNKNKYGKTLIFAVNRLHCVTLTKAFHDADPNLRCRYCISGEPGTQDTIRAFKNNDFEILINVQILTEGSDVPDIKTIFLTRQTNSDALLMQMIGRGLRGLGAGGTKNANIVDFHDAWDKFNFWLDPKDLLVDEFGLDAIETPSGVITTLTPSEQEEPKKYDPLELWDIYLKIYSAMEINATGLIHADVYPNGWYNVLNDNGKDEKLLVYDHQLDGYIAIEEDARKLREANQSCEYILHNYFDTEGPLPSLEDIKPLIEMIYENKEMPDYFTFVERDEVDAKIIAHKLIDDNLRSTEEDEFLIDLFNFKPIIREIYKTLPKFVENVGEARKEIKSGPKTRISVIESIDERTEFQILEGYYDLDALLREVKSEFVVFKDAILPPIRWSRRPLKSRFGICIRSEDNKYRIGMNKLLCSPSVPVDVVKFVIYHEMLHANGYWNHDGDFRNIEWKYPRTDECNGFLDTLFEGYRLDGFFEKKVKNVKNVKNGKGNSQLSETQQKVKQAYNVQNWPEVYKSPLNKNAPSKSVNPLKTKRTRKSQNRVATIIDDSQTS